MCLRPKACEVHRSSSFHVRQPLRIARFSGSLPLDRLNALSIQGSSACVCVTAFGGLMEHISMRVMALQL